MRCAVATLIFALGICCGCAAAAPNASARLRAYTLPAPRVLWLGGAYDDLDASYLAATCRWDLTYCESDTKNEALIYHSSDKAVEYTSEMSQAVADRLTRNLSDRFAALSTYQIVVFTGGTTDLTDDEQNKLVAWVQAGGLLITGRSVFAALGVKPDPIDAVLPLSAQKTEAGWDIPFGKPAMDPLVAGIPTDRIIARAWLPLPTPTADTVALTQTAKDQPKWTFGYYLRKVGKGAIVANNVGVVFGPSYQSGSMPGYWGHNPGGNGFVDRAAIMADLYRQISYWSVYGPTAFPAEAYLSAPDDVVQAGKSVEVGLTVLNAGVKGNLPAGVDVSAKLLDPLGAPVTGAVSMRLQSQAGAANAPESIAVSIPDDYPYTSTQMTVDLIDRASGDILHRASTYLTIAPLATIAATTDKMSYFPGDTVNVSVQPAGVIPTNATVRLVVHDFRGRIFGVVTAPITANKTVVLPWRFPSDGLGVDRYHFTGDLSVIADGKLRAATTIGIDDATPFDLRSQFVWGPWNQVLYSVDPLVARALALWQDTGYNAISAHAGGEQNFAWAQRLGWRAYSEGMPGPNMWDPQIDTIGDDALEAKAVKQLPKWMTNGEPSLLRSSSIALVSLGEEPGFNEGWGHTYYWDAPQAPANAAAVFQWYLKDQYHNDLSALNQEWGTTYAAWTEIPLTKQYSGGQSEAAKALKAIAKSAANSTVGDVLFYSAPYIDTRRFYDWYFNRIDTAGVKALRDALHPVWKTMFSAGLFDVKTDIPMYGNAGPFHPKESDMFLRDRSFAEYGDAPGFSGAMWDFLDDLPILGTSLWAAIANGDTYLDSWVDFDLCFNPDLTHTRSSFFKKRWLSAIRPISKILLDKRQLRDYQVGIYLGGDAGAPVMPWNDGGFGDGRMVQFSGLIDSGYVPTPVRVDEFAKCKVLFCPSLESMPAETADALRRYVRNGGTLIATLDFAAYTPHGNPLKTAPALGLADLIGTQVDISRRSNTPADFTADASLPEVTVHTIARDTLINTSPDVRVLGKFDDGQPAILSRKLGSGAVYYLNFKYDWTKWWNTFYTPEREAYRSLLGSIVSTVPGVSHPYFIRTVAMRPSAIDGWWKADINPDAVGHFDAFWASQLYTDPSGKARYMIVYSDHRSPIVDAHIEWVRTGDVAFDVLTHHRLAWQWDSAGRQYLPLTLGPGDGALIAFLPSLPSAITVTTASIQFHAGSPIKLQVAVAESLPSQSVARSMNLTVTGPNGSLLDGLSRQVNVLDTASIPLQTAINDPTGTWTVTVTDCVTGKQGSVRLTCLTNGSTPPAILDGSPSENWPRVASNADEFISQLASLTSTYRTVRDRTKLSYFEWFPGDLDSRHNIDARLSQLDWRDYAPAIIAALRGGQTVLLTGEDMGIDPASGLSMTPFADGHQFAAVASVLAAADRVVRPATLPSVIVGQFGQGRLLIDRTSIDAEGWTNAQIQPWRDQWMEHLEKDALQGTPTGTPVKNPTADGLRDWFLADRVERYWAPTP